MPPQEAPSDTSGPPPHPVSEHGSIWKSLAILGLFIVAGGAYWYTTQTTPEITPARNVYTNTEYGYQFEYPDSLTVEPATSRVVQMIHEEETVPLPAGSVEIPGYVIVSPISYSELSAEKPIYDYYSCCTGMAYSFDAQKKEWQASSIVHDVNADPEIKLEPASLNENGACSLVQTFGTRTFYKIQSGDEGVPTDYYYFLPTNKGYTLRFLSAYDLQADYSTYPEELKPAPQVLETIGEILASVTFVNDTTEMETTCR